MAVNYGAEPTFAEAWTQLTNAIKTHDTVWDAAAHNATSFLTLQDTATKAQEGEFAPYYLAGLQLERNGLASVMIASKENTVPAAIRTLGRVIGSTAQDTFTILDHLYDYFIAQGAAFLLKRISITRGSVSVGGSNVGDGTLHELYTDGQGHAIELGAIATTATTTTTQVKCTADRNHTGGSHGQAEYEVKTLESGSIDITTDWKGLNGSKKFEEIDAKNANLLVNGDFASLTAAEKPTGWVASDDGTTYTDYGVDTTAAVAERPLTGSITDAKPTGKFSTLTLGVNVAVGIKQFITKKLDPDTPYLALVNFKGDGTADGNVKITLGSKSTTVAVSTSYQQAIIGASTPSHAWYDQFTPGASPLVIQIERDSHTAGTVYIDSVIFVPYTIRFNGRWLAKTAGALESANDDVFTLADSISATPGTTQRYIGRHYNKYLPHAASAGASTPDYS